MTFYGKYTFQSTNPTGPKKYLTVVSSQGMTYPFVTADVVTETERWLVYQNDDGTLLVQMGNLFYLSAIEELGWVVGDTAREKAYPMKLTAQDDGTVAMQIFLADVQQWEPIRYSVNVLLPYLVFPIPKSQLINDDAATYFTFAQQTITPSLAKIQSSKNAKGLDFRHVDLSGANLSGVDCAEADFTNAILDSADFTGATLSGAVFVGASLRQTNLSRAILDSANFTGTNLSTVIWGQGISAKQTIFDDCVGVNSAIGSLDPKVNADFSGASFKGADFTGANFSYAILRETSLLGSVFVGANLQGVDFTQAQLGGLSKSAAANLAYAYLPNVNFSKANLFGISFAFASLFGAEASLTDAATMEEADFSNAYLEGIDLTGANLRGAKFNNACLVNVTLTKANLSPSLSGSVTSSFAGTCLQGASFAQSNLMNADLTGATVSFGNGTLNVRFCNPLIGGPFPPPPSFEPLNYSATTGLDLTTLVATTVCPNGQTVAANQAQGNSLQVMLTIHQPAVQWIPVQCAPSSEQSTIRPKASFRRQPSTVIETPDVVLKVFALRHFHDLRRLTDDPDARRYLFWNQHLTEQRLKAMIHYYRRQHQRSGISLWMAYRKADGAFIGVCGLGQNDVVSGVEINVAVMPEFRGNPLVYQLYRAVLDYGFSRIGLDSIFGLIEPANSAAEKFARRVGFRFERMLLVRGMIPYNLYEITEEALNSSVTK